MQKYKRRLAGVSVIISTLTTVLIFFVLTGTQVRPQELSSTNSQVIISGRPLSEVAMLLEGHFGKPVTYEDPVWMWEGDASPSAVARGLYPRDLAFHLPNELAPDQNPTLDIALLSKILPAYHADTIGPRFRVVSSRWGFHIVPEQVRDAKGQWVPVIPLLDTYISIPVANRTPSMHFNEICDALSKSAGIQIIPGAQWLDQYFGPNGLIPPRTRPLTQEEEGQISLAWGASTNAREALISLLEPSATTLSWDVRCSVETSNQNCVFNLNPIQILVQGPPGADGKQWRKAVIWDRNKSALKYLPEVLGSNH